MHESFEALSRELEERSPVQINGLPYGIWVIDIRERTPPDASVNVHIGARDQSESFTGMMHLAKDHLQDIAHVADLAVETMRQIVTGELPPGVRQLL